MIHSVRFTCVLDTNVIYPLWVRDLLLWFAYCDLYTPKWSHHIFDEWIDVMLRKGISKDEVTISVDLNDGQASTTWWTCDFSEKYIEINASYRT